MTAKWPLLYAGRVKLIVCQKLRYHLFQGSVVWNIKHHRPGPGPFQTLSCSVLANRKWLRVGSESRRPGRLLRRLGEQSESAEIISLSCELCEHCCLVVWMRASCDRRRLSPPRWHGDALPRRAESAVCSILSTWYTHSGHTLALPLPPYPECSIIKSSK